MLLAFVGCSEAPVSMNEQVHQVEEELERPGVNNNEPTILVNELNRLIDEFEVEQDSSLLIEAWEIAIELAEYEGPMAETFEAIGAYAAGDTVFTPVKDRTVARFMGKTGPCEDECTEQYVIDRHDAYVDLSDGLIGCGLAGFVAGAYAGPAAFAAGGATFGACGAWVALIYWRARSRAGRDYDRCMEDC